MFKLLLLSVAGVVALGAYNLSTGHDLFHLPGSRTIRSAVHGTVQNTVRDGVQSAARETSAEVKERAAEVKDQASASVHAAALTTKIKAKMALDDAVTSSNINVDTDGGVVTLTGTVASKDEQKRAVRIATETAGVNKVVNHLRVR
jgi:osmotically-inducible protein OsmY